MFDPIKASTLLPDNSMPRLRMTYDLATHSQESNQSVITFAPRNMLAGSGRFGEVISGPAQFHPRASNRTRHRALGRGGGGSVGLSTDSQEPPAAAANPVSYVVLKLVCLKGTDPHSPDLQSLAGELRWLIQEAQIYSGAAKAQQGRTIPVYYGLYPARVKATRLGEKEVCMRRPKHGEEPDHILVNILLECLYNSRQDGYNVDSDVEVDDVLAVYKEFHTTGLLHGDIWPAHIHRTNPRNPKLYKTRRTQQSRTIAEDPFKYRIIDLETCAPPSAFKNYSFEDELREVEDLFVREQVYCKDWEG